jgi:hypothetical protein
MSCRSLHGCHTAQAKPAMQPVRDNCTCSERSRHRPGLNAPLQRMRRTDRELAGCSLRPLSDATPHIDFYTPRSHRLVPGHGGCRLRRSNGRVSQSRVYGRGSARENDALAGQDMPAVVLVLDLLDATEARHVLAQHHFDHAGLSLENSDSFIRAAHPPAGEDLTSRGCRPRRLLNGSGDFGG